MRFSKRHVWLLIGVILLVAAQAAEAQEICYGYDKLGRLVGVVDQEGKTAIYDYDAVGNILAIRRNDATSPVAITAISSTTGTEGEQVQILGIGFSNVTSENQVTINGVPATVVSATSCSLIVEIPIGATSGVIGVTTPTGSATSSEALVVLNMTIFPAQAAMVTGTSRQFTATITGTGDQRVIWGVNDVEGGNSTIGTITQGGIYTAPASVPTPPTVAVQARSIPFSALVAEATVTIVSEANRFASAPPVSVQFGPPQNAVNASPVSVNFGPPPPGVVNARPVSVLFGVPPATVFAPSVSVANAPVITAVAPDNGAQGTTVNVTLTGANFTGATELVFLLGGSADSALTVGSLNVNGAGDQLTADVTIALSATVGPRIVIVKTSSGNSTAANTGNNVFEVTAP